MPDGCDHIDTTLEHISSHKCPEYIVASVCEVAYLRDGKNVACDLAWRQELLRATRKTIMYYNLADLEWVLTTAAHILTPEQLTLIQREQGILMTRAGVVAAIS